MDGEKKYAMGAIQTAYAGAHYGKSLFWYMTELLFGFYLAEIYRIPPETLGTLLFVFLVWDAVTDPIISVALWRRPKSTKALLRYQAAGALFSSISFVLVFIKPHIGLNGLEAYALFVGILFRTAYTVFDVPQNALLPRLAQTRSQRLILASARTALSALATLTVSFAAAVIIGEDVSERGEQGFAIAAATFVIVALGSAVLLAFAGRKAADAPPPSARSRGFPELMRTTFLQPTLARLFVAIFFLSLGWPLFGKLVPFFASYILGDPEATGILLATIAIATLLSQPLWMAMGRAVSRRRAVAIGAVLVAASSVFYWAEAGSGLSLAVAGVALMAATTSAMGVLAWAMLADELSAGGGSKANDVIAFGVFTFSSKIALGVGGLVLGWLLTAVGYAPGEALAPAGRSALTLAMAAAPVVSTVMATAVILGVRR